MNKYVENLQYTIKNIKLALQLNEFILINNTVYSLTSICNDNFVREHNNRIYNLSCTCE